MVIWTRWGILALLIPMAFILVAQAAVSSMRGEDRKTVKRVKPADESEGAGEAESSEELAALEVAEQKRLVEREKAVARSKKNGYAIGCFAAAVALWPLGRQMNASKFALVQDPQTGQFVEGQVGGGHTMFFIPLEYWAFIWPVLGLFKLLSRT